MSIGLQGFKEDAGLFQSHQFIIMLLHVAVSLLGLWWGFFLGGGAVFWGVCFLLGFFF